MPETIDKKKAAEYRGYAGLPALVGLHGMDEVQTTGLTVQESVSRLLRLHWAMRRLHGILIAHIASEPVYELKMAYSLHAHILAEHVGAIAGRVREMRQPPYGLETCPDAALDQMLDEILCAPDTTSLVAGVYGVTVPALTAALSGIVKNTNRLFDHPTYRICRLALVEMEEVEAYGKEAVTCLCMKMSADQKAWQTSLENLLKAVGGLDGCAQPSGKRIERIYSKTPFVYDGTPKRDERFQDPYNMGVNAEAMLFREDIPAQPKTLMLYFKRMREIDVPEVIAGIMAETPGQPWEYYRDMTRQLWDEARHAMMGEVGFVSLGVDWKTIPFNLTWSLGLNTKLAPLDRHAVLFTIEQGLMPKKTGKEYEWEVAVAAADPLSELIQDYDWADEILHARIGRDWLVPKFGTMPAAQALGDQAWSSILIDWERWKEQGLTQHRNWWPDVYKQACATWNVPVDPAVLAYCTTYKDVRADMKDIPAMAE